MSHERSITLNIDGKWMNFKTVFNKKVVTDREVMKMYRNGLLKPLGGKVYPTAAKAIQGAKARSEKFK